MMRRNRHCWYGLLGVFITSIASVSCSRTEYELIDSQFESGIWAYTTWMDDYRVIFHGGTLVNEGVYIWDTRTNTVTKYADAIWKVCYDRDTQYIYYAIKDEGKIIHVMHGKMGEEKLEAVPNEDKNLQKLSALNRFTCVPRDLPSGKFKVLHQYLKPGHGFIKIEWMNGRETREEYVNGNGQAFPLPIYFMPPEAFYVWKNAYFVWNSGWARGGWLYPDRGFEEVRLEPPSPNLSGSKIALPVRNGFLYISHDIDSISDPGKSGIYVYRDGRYMRAVVGLVDSVSISPDGCKAAFVHVRSIAQVSQGKRTMKMIDVCSTQQEGRG